MNIQVKLSTVPTSQPLPPTVYSGWRCLHIAEGGYQSDPNGMPEVRPSFNAPSIEFTRSMQFLSWELMSRNPNITRWKHRVVYGNTTAFTNGQGYFKDGDPRADWINGLDTQYKNPRLMKAIICGGMFIRGEVGYSVMQAISDALRLVKTMTTSPRSLVGKFQKSFSALVTNNVLVCRPGIHGIDARAPIPSVEEVLEKNWYFAATTSKSGNVSHFPQGNGQPVLVPYFLIEPVTYPLEWFTRWEQTYLPDPLTIYL